VFGFREVSSAASALETAAADRLAGVGSLEGVENALEALRDCIPHA
jgi:hypothetical protein